MISRRSFITGTSALVAGALLGAYGCAKPANSTNGTSKSSVGSSSSAADALTSSSHESANASASSSAASSFAASSLAQEATAVVYFSATGNTRKVAEDVAARLGVTTQEIVPAQEYTTDDLNYNDDNARATVDARDDAARPALAAIPDVSGASIVYLGYPIWWGRAAAPLRTYVESAELSGKTIVPFCTSGSSPVESASLQALAPNANWKSGMRMTRDAAGIDALVKL